MKRILSVQGGGIRGILPASALIAIEAQIGKPACEIFDFVGGTSTGALLAASIVSGVSAKDALAVYVDKGRDIFPGGVLVQDAEMLTRGRRFDNRVMGRIVREALGDRVKTINDSPIGIMITAASMDKHQWYFVKDAETNASTTGKASLFDVAMGSACATTYHDPWMVPGFGYFSDGGTVGLSDPVYETCVEALARPFSVLSPIVPCNLHPDARCYGSLAPEETIVLSLGTGYFKPNVTLATSPPESLLQRVEWVTDALLGASETLALQSAKRQWPGIIHTWNQSLPRAIDMSDASSIRDLVNLGKDAVLVDWKATLCL